MNTFVLGWLFASVACGERRYSVANVQCDLASTQECVEACEVGKCGDISFLTLDEARSCVPHDCTIPVRKLAYWAFPVCADEEKGIYAIQVSRDNSNITQSMQMIEETTHLKTKSNVWVTIVTEEWSNESGINAPALIAIADRQVVGANVFCEAPELSNQHYVSMTRFERPRANALSFSLAPMVDLGLRYLLERRKTITILLQPQLKYFSRLAKVGSDVGLGAVELYETAA